MQCRIGAMTLHDMPAVSDTVNHSILPQVLRRRFGIDGSVRECMVEVLSDRHYIVRVGTGESGN